MWQKDNWLLVVTISVRSQVANYVNGGHYNPHHDYVMKEREPDHVREEDSEMGKGKDVGLLTLT